jgi:hypothetical protein
VDSITSNLGAIVLVIAGVGLVIMLVLQALQISQLRERLEMLTRGSEGESLEEVLSQHLETVHQVGRDLDELTARTAILESSGRHHFARQGLVRFNPFPDTGGNQSFVLALLDESEDGFVVSSLHSRTGTRIYAKAISSGKADMSLSSEETEAVDAARSRRPARPAQAPARNGGRTAVTPQVPAAAADDVPVAARTGSTPVKAAPVRASAPVKAQVPAKAATAELSSDRRSASGSETNRQTVATKGQSKVAETAADPTDAPIESEMTGRKPGRAPAQDSPQTDTPGS